MYLVTSCQFPTFKDDTNKTTPTVKTTQENKTVMISKKSF